MDPFFLRRGGIRKLLHEGGAGFPRVILFDGQERPRMTSHAVQIPMPSYQTADTPAGQSTIAPTHIPRKLIQSIQLEIPRFNPLG